MKPRKLHVAGALVLAAWVASLGWLVRREYFTTGRAPGERALYALVSPETHFFRVFQGSQPVGYASVSVDTSATGVRVSERYHLVLGEGAQSRNVRYTLDTELSPSLTLRHWIATLRGDTPPYQVSGTMGDSGLAAVVLTEDSATHRARLRVGNALPLAPWLVRLAATRRLQQSPEVSARLLDPLTATPGVESLRLSGQFVAYPVDSAQYVGAADRWEPARHDTVTAWALRADPSKSNLRMWVDGNGHLLRALLPNGLVLERTAFEIAQLNFSDGKAEAVRLQGFDAVPQSSPEPSEADTRPTLLAAAPDSLVRANASAATAAAVSRADTLRSLARSTAREFPGREWLQSRRFVAMARSLGIPARLTGGALARDGAWTMGCWAEAWDEGWRTVDTQAGDLRPEAGQHGLAFGIACLPIEYEPLVHLLPGPQS
ncbi:MAG TPA: transglutaminase domain-containing protein [Gemmatimonadales bacterium]|nr:transglutaminase domain-containing protein [Gemmatimonadales bacterium]